jgi:hypothetical protein
VRVSRARKAEPVSVEIIEHAGSTLTARVSGKLTQPELAALQDAAGDILKKHGKTRLLILTDNFEGWERGGDWGDLSFSIEHDKHIEKMAIVGETKWEDLALLFTSKGLRPFPIEYFVPGDIAKARAWLAEESAESPSH